MTPPKVIKQDISKNGKLELFTSKGESIHAVHYQEALEQKLIPRKYVKDALDRNVAYPHLVTAEYLLSSERALLIRACEQLLGQEYIVVWQGKKAAIWRT